MTAKKSLARVPFLGWFMTLSGTVFIDRKNRETAVRAFDGAAEEMRREAQSVFIFPEGTRSYATGPELLAFKKGAFHLAVKAGVPVVPVVAGVYAGVMSVRERRFEAGSIPVKGELLLFFFGVGRGVLIHGFVPHSRSGTVALGVGGEWRGG